MKIEIGDWVRMPSERPHNWNNSGGMDKWLDKIVMVETVSSRTFTFVGQEGWTFLIEEIVENLGKDYIPEEIKNNYSLF